MKLKESVKKILSNYMMIEERIETFIDEGFVEKIKFKFCTYITDDTDFNWSIK